MIIASMSRVPKLVVFSSVLAIVATLLFVINDATIKYLSLKNIKFYHFISMEYQHIWRYRFTY